MIASAMPDYIADAFRCGSFASAMLSTPMLFCCSMLMLLTAFDYSLTAHHAVCALLFVE